MDRTASKLRDARLALLAVALMVSVTAGCGKKAPQSSSPAVTTPAIPAPLVTVVKATAQDVPRYLDEIGKNMAYESVTVTPQIEGRIIERHFSDGNDIRKGQLLFVIDPRPYKAQVDSAQASLAQAKATLDYDRIEFARYAEIVETRAVSRLDYDTKKSAVEVDQAKVEAAQAALEAAKLNLDYCYIHSPIDGRAGARLVDIGNVVQANSTALLSIQRLDPIYATFTITEGDLPEVQKQMQRGTLKAAVRLPSDPENSARSGRIEFLDNMVQSGSGTVNLRATLSNPGHHFWPGQFVNVRLVLATQKGAVLIPKQAAQLSQQGPFVYVVKPDDVAELRQVNLGQRQGERVVVEGVAANERVVLTGQTLVRAGAKVRIDTGAPAGPASNTDHQAGEQAGEQR